MAQVRLDPPEPFNFKTPDDWPRWLRRFEQFRVASGLTEDSPSKQANTLLYCLGEEADAVLTSTNATADERASYDSVIGKFNEFFNVRKNVIFERARFNRRNQLGGETAEQYIMELYTLVKNCEYGDFESQMMRDRLVVGIRNAQLSERLQLDADLTLEKAKNMVRQKEAVQEQQHILKGDESGQVGEVKSQRPKTGKQPGVKRTTPTQKQKSCTRCGRGQHSRDKCPAKDQTCHKCQRKGHYSSQCFSKTVAEVSSESCLDSAFLDTVTAKQETSWKVKIHLCDKDVEFKLDTGAEVTAISDKTLKHLGRQQLKRPEKSLFGPAHQQLQVMGQLEGTLSYKGRSVTQSVYVVKGLNLLGLPAITSLNMAAMVDVTTVQSNIMEEFPTVFEGLGNLGEEYEIKLKPDAKPHALFAARNVPLPLRKKVQEELRRMESMGVISKVEEPTPWCAGMVVIPKKNGSVRICVDLKPLNESVLREVHPLPRVDDTLAQMSGAKVFSKLDANSGFWQIPLAQQSRLLTTFVTPHGRFCFNKLPFGISSAPEHFQKRMSNILAGLEGVVCQVDDVLVFGENIKEHDSRLRAALQRKNQDSWSHIESRKM